MKLPLFVEIYSYSICLTAEQSAATSAVGFLYSQYLFEERVTTEHFTKVALMLVDKDVVWDGDIRDRVAMIYQAFKPPPDVKENWTTFQVHVLDTLCLALRKLTGTDAIPLQIINKCRANLLGDGFVQVVGIDSATDKKTLKIGKDHQIRLRLKTGALRYQYVLELSDLAFSKRVTYPLLLIMSSWLLARVNLVKWSLINNKKTLVLTLEHPRQIDPPYASYLELNAMDGKYYDEQVCELPVSKTINDDLVTFKFDITELKRGLE